MRIHRKLCALICLLTSISQLAYAEGVWIDEQWQHVSKTLSCDGLPIIIDADIMQIPTGQTVQEYRTKSLNANFAREKAKAIDWSQFDCEIGQNDWIQDGGSYYCSNVDKDMYCGIMTFCELNIVNKGAAAQSPYRYIAADMQYDIDKSSLGTLTWSDITNRAEQTASILGLQLGEPQSMKRCEDFLQQGQEDEESFEVWRQMFFPNISKSEADDIKTLEVIFPAYYNGLRLYSGTTFSLQGEAFIPQMSFDIQLHHSGSILKLFCPVYDEWVPEGPASPAITGDNALDLFQAAYTEMFLPGISCVKVEHAALEYTAISGDQTASKGFKIFPVWVFRIVIESEENESWKMYVGFHAITGEKLF